MNTNWKYLLHRLRRDQRGAVAIMAAFGLLAIAGMTGLVTQETILYRAQSALQSSANLAALAGAQDLNTVAGTAKTSATSYSAVDGGLNASSSQTVTMASGYPQLKCLNSLKSTVPCTGPDLANAIVVKQQTTVPLIFGGLFGKSSKTITATATAAAGGGNGVSSGGVAKPLDVMIIVDTTIQAVRFREPPESPARRREPANFCSETRLHLQPPTDFHPHWSASV